MRNFTLAGILFLAVCSVYSESPVWIGIEAGDVPECLKSHLDIREGVALMVTNVAAGSPAAQAGIQQYDVITEADSRRFNGIDEFRRIIASCRNKQHLSFTLIRKGRMIHTAVVPAEQGGRKKEWIFPQNRLHVAKKKMIGVGRAVLESGQSMSFSDFFKTEEFAHLRPETQKMIREHAQSAVEHSAESLRCFITGDIGKDYRTSHGVGQGIEWDNGTYTTVIKNGTIIELKENTTGKMLLKDVPVAEVKAGQAGLDASARSFIEKACGFVVQSVYVDYCAPAEEFSYRDKELENKAEKLIEMGTYTFKTLSKFYYGGIENDTFKLSVRKGVIKELVRKKTGEVLIKDSPLDETLKKIERNEITLDRDVLIFLLKEELKGKDQE